MNLSDKTAENQLFADRYTLLRAIGEGGTGVVYEASHIFTEQRVALKILHSTFSLNKVGRERFLREARTSTRINHPAIVQVLDAGSSENGVPYLAFEFLEGEDLAAAHAEGRCSSIGDMIKLTLEVLDALEASHNVGLIHRDIKPGNIFLSRSYDGTTTVKLLDFGITRSLDTVTRASEGGGLLGTLQYMSPEQAKGDPVDGRSDLFSVGAMLFEALTGRSPFQAEDNVKMLLAVIDEQAPQVRSIRPDVPNGLAQIIDRALQREPEGRWPSARAMRDAFASLQDVGVPIAGGDYSPSTKRQRLPLLLFGVLFSVLLIACVIVWGFLLMRPNDSIPLHTGGQLAHVTPDLMSHRLRGDGWFVVSHWQNPTKTVDVVTATRDGTSAVVHFYDCDSNDESSCIVQQVRVVPVPGSIYVQDELRLISVYVTGLGDDSESLFSLLLPEVSEPSIQRSPAPAD